MKYIFLIVAFITIKTADAQIGFIKKIGDTIKQEYALDMMETIDSSIVVTGFVSQIIPPGKGLLIELDSKGVEKYKHIIIDSILLNNDIGFNSLTYKNQKYYLTGWNDNDNNIVLDSDISIFSVDTNGATKWSIRTGDTLVSDIGVKILTSNHFIYVLGLGDSTYNPKFIKTDTNGNTLFQKSYNAPFMYGKQSQGMIQINDSTFILAGDGNLAVAAKDRWMIKVNSNGDTAFCKVLTNYGAGWVTDIAQGYNNSVYYLGNSIGRYSYNGDSISERYYSEFAVAYSMIKSKDSNLIIAGITANFNFSITKVDTFGNVLWSHAYDYMNQFDNLTKVIATMDGGYLMCGSTFDGLWGDDDILLVKVDSMGELHFATNINPTESESEKIIIYPNPSNGIYNLTSTKPIQQVNVYSITGQLIRQYKSDTDRVDITDFASSNYILEVKTAHKFLKQKITKW